MRHSTRAQLCKVSLQISSVYKGIDVFISVYRGIINSHRINKLMFLISFQYAHKIIVAEHHAHRLAFRYSIVVHGIGMVRLCSEPKSSLYCCVYS